MKKQILFLVLSLISITESFTQIVFEKGYYIDESDQKVECLIKNIDWKHNPKEIEYMLPQDNIVQLVNIENIKEFGIVGVSRYVKANVKIDRSSNAIINMSSNKNPDFHEEILFLNVLVEGNASLYVYEEANLTRFFYSIDGSEIEQLVHKPYLVNNKIARNNYFKQQIINNLVCEEIDMKDIEYLTYGKSDLKKIFIKYNTCINSVYTTYESKQKKNYFNLTIKPGLNYNALAIKNSMENSMDTDFGDNWGIRFGFEAEYIFPFNKNKWGVIIKPAFQYFSSETSKESNTISGGIIISKVLYGSLEIPVGVRYNIFLNDKSKIMLTGSYIFCTSNYSEIKFTRNDGSLLKSLDINPRRNVSFGLGYKYKDRYSLEFYYQTNRELLGDYLFWNSEYKTFSILIGYTLF
ncbi:MAG: hypothetical protein JXB00_18130 [Bacteroidales bacterium]|nr:hypothetical protein [Bacteroidales bacterium]